MPVSPSPDLQLLWEPNDPGPILTSRFGFRDAAEAGTWVADAVAQHWSLPIQSCTRIVLSATNALAWINTAPGRLVAKWSVAHDRFAGLADLATLTNWLAGRGIPVSVPLAAVDGRRQVEFDGVSMNLQHQLDGELLDVTEPAQVRAAGAALARLQDALAGYPEAERFTPVGQPVLSPATAITRWLDGAGAHLAGATRDRLRQLVAGAPADRLPVQLLHQDFRAANILCADATVTAILDFEQAGLGHRVDELARAAVLLGTRFRQWGPVSPDVHGQFLTGYRSVRPLTPVEAAWWDILVAWHSVLMVPAGDDPTGWGPAARSCLAAIN